jgi:hypothetical protein
LLSLDSGLPGKGIESRSLLDTLYLLLFDAPLSRPMAMGLSIPVLRSSTNGRARPRGPPSVNPSVHPSDQNARGDPLSRMSIKFQNCACTGPSQEMIWQKVKIIYLKIDVNSAKSDADYGRAPEPGLDDNCVPFL